MEPKTLNDISTALERVVKNLRGATPTKKRMSLDRFMSYALAQIGKAGEDQPEVAQRRLAALKRSVDDVIGQVAKMVAEDTESESIKVEVETAFAPTGGTPMDGLTTAEDQSSTELPLAGAGSVGKKLEQVGQALAKLQAELEEDPSPKPRASARKSGADRGGGQAAEREPEGDAAGAADRDGWPLDLSTDAFLKGGSPAETGLTWGADPEGVAAPKNR